MKWTRLRARMRSDRPHPLGILHNQIAHPFRLEAMYICREGRRENALHAL